MEQSDSTMRLFIFIFLVFMLTNVHCSTIPDSEKKQRIHETSLSEADHEIRGEHNDDYDHDAFLGHEEAETFDQLSPEESKSRLAIIVVKIDKNGDGFVTELELKDWIQYIQRRYIITDTARMWRDHEPDADNTLVWESYQKRTFGYHDEPKEGSPTFEYKNMIERDRRRWVQADRNQDGKLSKEEFQDFLHPEEAEHMRSIVVDETLEDIDKDGNGYIDPQEYIDDIWGDDDDDEDEDEADGDKGGEPEWVKSEREQFTNFRDKNHDGKLDRREIEEWIIPEDYDHSSAEAAHLVQSSDANRVCDMYPRNGDDDQDQEEPDWVKSEREQFASYRDKNKDGKLDKDEVMEWIIPHDYDHSLAEAKHLIFESDANKDGKLSNDEILDKYDLFVGSQATDFGEALTKHDEF